jgi:hypothetical protein
MVSVVKQHICKPLYIHSGYRDLNQLKDMPEQTIGSRFNPATFMFLSQARTWISNGICSGMGFFCVHWVKVCTVDICGIRVKPIKIFSLSLSPEDMKIGIYKDRLFVFNVFLYKFLWRFDDYNFFFVILLRDFMILYRKTLIDGIKFKRNVQHSTSSSSQIHLPKRAQS